MKLSIVLPVYNEEESIPELFSKLHGALEQIGKSFEIIAVNDGSKDGTEKVLNQVERQYPNIKLIHFRINAGQTAALHAGIEHASGEVIVLMDSDLENDSEDIKLLLEKIDKGFDVVSGWRKGRWSNSKFTRKLPSVLANKLISWISGVKLHDYGCTLKAYKADVIQGVRLYGEMHRFIPAYAAQVGAQVTEVKVNYTPRKYGKSNYGLSRTRRVILDLFVLKFLHTYMDRPMQLFGKIGFYFGLVGVFAGVLAIVLRLGYGLHFVQTPLPVFAALCIIVGVQLLTMGILAEMVMRTYFESQNKKTYLIKKKINF